MQHRAVPVLNVPQVAEQLPVQIALPLQIGIEHLTCGGEGEWCVGAVHQGHPQGVLQLGQILAEIGLGEIQLLGGLRDAALLGDGEKIFRILDEHKRPSQSSGQTASEAIISQIGMGEKIKSR